MRPHALTELLGIDHPILQGGMTWVSRHALAAAVSEAGALGVIGSGGLSAPELREEIRLLRERTARPFGVNVPLIDLRPAGEDDIVARLIDVVLEERVPVVVTGAGSPQRYTARLKARGALVLHVVPTVRLALKAEAAGVDAVIAESVEAGGHVRCDGPSTFSLVPQVADAVALPVVAAGGIADARGMLAAMALGAQGVQLGTRFVATRECNAHPAFKQALVAADAEGTAVYSRAYHAARALTTPAVRRMLAMEGEGADPEEVRRFRGRGRAHAGCIEGDLEQGLFPAGAAAGLVDRVLPVAEVIAELVEGYAAGLERLGSARPGPVERGEGQSAA